MKMIALFNSPKEHTPQTLNPYEMLFRPPLFTEKFLLHTENAAQI